MNFEEMSKQDKQLYKMAYECSLKGIDIEKSLNITQEEVVVLTYKNFMFLKQYNNEVKKDEQTDDI